MDAILPSLVTTGSDYAARKGAATDDNRLIAVVRVVTLLHGGKKGIHVDMDNFALLFAVSMRTEHGQFIGCHPYALASETGPIGWQRPGYREHLMPLGRRY